MKLELYYITLSTLEFILRYIPDLRELVLAGDVSD